jgi:hypothetical protein
MGVLVGVGRVNGENEDAGIEPMSFLYIKEIKQ